MEGIVDEPRLNMQEEKKLTSRMLMRKSALQPRSRKTPTGGKMIAKLENRDADQEHKVFGRYEGYFDVHDLHRANDQQSASSINNCKS